MYWASWAWTAVAAHMETKMTARDDAVFFIEDPLSVDLNNRTPLTVKGSRKVEKGKGEKVLRYKMNALC